MLFVAMLCWGSWANFQRLASVSFIRFYINYSIGIFLAALIILGIGFYYVPAMMSDSDKFSALGFALLAGLVWNGGNILLTKAIRLVGMSVAFPIGIGIALIEGVITNYIAQPSANVYLLFTGVATIVFAIFIDAYACYLRDKSKHAAHGSKIGIFYAVIAGLILGWVFRILMISMTKPEHISAFSAVPAFAFGVLLSTLVLGYIYKNKFKNSNERFKAKSFGYSIAAGLVWATGLSCVLFGSAAAGFAISDALSQGATMVAALWGVFLWKEFASYKKTWPLLALGFVSYILGLGLVIMSHYFS
ncbi:hypothetical protein BGC07_05935 [Piscirickettsia litoralis]|uniref:Multidrug DMT transporter permease n=2 Tax=Piscirickettsia litoralis TaxID=1891921 RepID=A0ABX3A583_9GAMM|nr:hypothetical protein BGC07_05935 [Piscirickettsia litoralis]